MLEPALAARDGTYAAIVAMREAITRIAKTVDDTVPISLDGQRHSGSADACHNQILAALWGALGSSWIDPRLKVSLTAKVRADV